MRPRKEPPISEDPAASKRIEEVIGSNEAVGGNADERNDESRFGRRPSSCREEARSIAGERSHAPLPVRRHSRVVDAPSLHLSLAVCDPRNLPARFAYVKVFSRYPHRSDRHGFGFRLTAGETTPSRPNHRWMAQMTGVSQRSPLRARRSSAPGGPHDRPDTPPAPRRCPAPLDDPPRLLDLVGPDEQRLVAGHDIGEQSRRRRAARRTLRRSRSAAAGSGGHSPSPAPSSRTRGRNPRRLQPDLEHVGVHLAFVDDREQAHRRLLNTTETCVTRVASRLPALR